MNTPFTWYEVKQKIQDLETRVTELEALLGKFMEAYDNHTHYKGMEFVSTTYGPSRKATEPESSTPFHRTGPK